MSKHWNPKKQPVTLGEAPPRISRIRRDPVRTPSPAELKKAELRKREREIWGGVSGMALFGIALAVTVVGISIATVFRDDPEAAARARRFGQCYDTDGPNCVVDGQTIYVANSKLEIAGIAAPRIDGAACPTERSRGIDSAVHLANLLNSGKVTVGPPFRGPDGREVRSVAVGGDDVAGRMIAEGVARPADGSSTDWCGGAS